MNELDNIGAKFAQFYRYLDAIIDPREADDDSLTSKVKQAIINAYSNGYHDGQQDMFKRLPKPSDTGGDEGGREYYDSL